jgi:glycosyltransferase involved in cell wall biosynthesis
MKNIAWLTHSPQKLGDGYGYASDSIYSRLKKNICFENNELEIDLPPGVGYSVEKKSECSVVINNGLPIHYSTSGNYKVGFTYWETTKVPDSWIPMMRGMSEIWTTSDFVFNVFKDCDVNENIYKFNLGFDNNIFKKIEEIPDKPFTFLSIGSPSTRKNSQMTVDAFLKVKNKYNNIRLIYKSNGPPDARLYANTDSMKSIYGTPDIDVVDHLMSETEFANLYAKAHCLVYPTSGEGWGMIPFQSIAMGIPTICTNATSCTEYAKLSIPLDYKMDSSNMFGIYRDCGTWAKPSFDDLCDKMIHVIENYELEKEKALEASEYLHKNYTWDVVAKEYEKRIWEILKK